MFARLVSAKTNPEGFDNLVSFTEEKLPGFQGQPGFKGFYLLTSRDTGDLVTISLWDTWEDIQALQAAAAQANHEAAESVETVAAPVTTYHVEIAHLA